MNQENLKATSNQFNHSNGGVVLFFFLTYLFTWTFHIAIPVQGLPFTFNISKPAMLLYLVGILGPFVSAVIVTARSKG